MLPKKARHYQGIVDFIDTKDTYYMITILPALFLEHHH